MGKWLTLQKILRSCELGRLDLVADHRNGAPRTKRSAFLPAYDVAHCISSEVDWPIALSNNVVTGCSTPVRIDPRSLIPLDSTPATEHGIAQSLAMPRMQSFDRLARSFKLLFE